LSETEILGLLRPAQANLGYFLAWFHSLSSCPRHSLQSPFDLIPLAPKSRVSLCTQLRREFSFFVFRSGLSVTGLARVSCILKCLYALLVFLLRLETSPIVRLRRKGRLRFKTSELLAGLQREIRFINVHKRQN
jgi:hypothetical protein